MVYIPPNYSNYWHPQASVPFVNPYLQQPTMAANPYLNYRQPYYGNGSYGQQYHGALPGGGGDAPIGSSNPSGGKGSGVGQPPPSAGNYGRGVTTYPYGQGAYGKPSVTVNLPPPPPPPPPPNPNPYESFINAYLGGDPSGIYNQSNYAYNAATGTTTGPGGYSGQATYYTDPSGMVHSNQGTTYNTQGQYNPYLTNPNSLPGQNAYQLGFLPGNGNNLNGQYSYAGNHGGPSHPTPPNLYGGTRPSTSMYGASQENGTYNFPSPSMGGHNQGQGQQGSHGYTSPAAGNQQNPYQNGGYQQGNYYGGPQSAGYGMNQYGQPVYNQPGGYGNGYYAGSGGPPPPPNAPGPGGEIIPQGFGY